MPFIIDNAVIETLLVVFQCILFAVILFSFIYSYVEARKSADYSKLKMLCFTTLGIVTVSFSWLLNFGWVRFILTMLMVPFSHATVVVVMNMWVFEYLEKSKILKNCNLIFNITYLLCYLLLPDSGEFGLKYVFFRLIDNNVIAGIAEWLCIGAVLVHLVVVFIEVVQVLKLKKQE